MADGIARSAARLPFFVCPALPFGDLLLEVRRDFLAWCRLLWPYYGSGPTGATYFTRVDFKDPRPWFRGLRAPRRHINLITRLRTGHVCTGEHFARMGWDLEIGCGCGEELKSLEHLFLSCPLLSEGRPGIFGFLASRFPGLLPDLLDYRELVFDPDPVPSPGSFLTKYLAELHFVFCEVRP